MMETIELRTRGPSPQDNIEDESKFLLKKSLLSKSIQVTYTGDKYPNIDGFIEFFNENGSTTVKAFFQLKGSEQDKMNYDCDVEYLNYCYLDKAPNLIFLANIPRQKVYWEHINQSYIVSSLGIEDLMNFKQKTKRIIFVEDKEISSTTSEIFETCQRHYENNLREEEYRVTIAEEAQLASGEEVAFEVMQAEMDRAKQEVIAAKEQVDIIEGKGIVQDKEFEKVKEKITQITENLGDQMLLYYAFIHLLRPFYIDGRGDMTRDKLRKLLSISKEQEQFVIRTLLQNQFIQQVGNLIAVTEKWNALSTLNMLLEEKRIKLNEITNLFLSYE